MKTQKTFFTLVCMILIFVNAHAQYWNISGNSGTSSTLNYIGTSDNTDLKIRTNGSTRMVISKTGNVSVGTTAATLAKFTTTGAVGNTTAVFGSTGTGVSLQQSYPGISFNSYYNAGYKALGAGYGGNFTLDPSNGKLLYRTISNASGAGVAQTYATPFVITNSGIVGIGNTNPDVSVDLHVGTTTGAAVRIGDQSQFQDKGNMLLGLSSTLIPTADVAYHLGATSYRWLDVWSLDGSINTSDRRDKTNIRDINYGLNEVMKLHPVIFNWKEAPERGDKLGLIAQELQTVIKEAVVTKTITTDENGKKIITENDRIGVFYSDLIPVLVKAMQEQQGEIENKEAKIQALETQLKATSKRLNNIEESLGLCCNYFKTMQDESTADNAILQQNAPNPFSSKSEIRFYIPVKAASVLLKIFSSDGKEMSSHNIATRGEGKIEIPGSMLQAGIYNYTLFIDGKSAASKQMVIMQE